MLKNKLQRRKKQTWRQKTELINWLNWNCLSFNQKKFRLVTNLETAYAVVIDKPVVIQEVWNDLLLNEFWYQKHLPFSQCHRSALDSPGYLNMETLKYNFFLLTYHWKSGEFLINQLSHHFNKTKDFKFAWKFRFVRSPEGLTKGGCIKFYCG